MKLNRRVVDKPRNGSLVSFSPNVKGDAERFAKYYADKPKVIQRLAAAGYVEVELQADTKPEEPQAPRRGASKARSKTKAAE